MAGDFPATYATHAVQLLPILIEEVGRACDDKHCSHESHRILPLVKRAFENRLKDLQFLDEKSFRNYVYAVTLRRRKKRISRDQNRKLQRDLGAVIEELPDHRLTEELELDAEILIASLESDELAMWNMLRDGLGTAAIGHALGIPRRTIQHKKRLIIEKLRRKFAPDEVRRHHAHPD